MRMINPFDMFYQNQYPPQMGYGYSGSSIFHYDDNRNTNINPNIETKESTRPLSDLTTMGFNHIVAAHYIKSVQNARSVQNSNVSFKSVNASTGASQAGNQGANQENQPTSQDKINNNNNNNENNNKDMNNDMNNISINNIDNNKKVTAFDNNKPKENITSDVNSFTNLQLNSVNDLIKKLQENKMNELVQKDISGDKKESNNGM
jgi:hypothetical protein